MGRNIMEFFNKKMEEEAARKKLENDIDKIKESARSFADEIRDHILEKLFKPIEEIEKTIRR